MQEAPTESARVDQAKQKVLRIGSAILGFGVTVALVAAIIGGANPGARVNPMRVTGGTIMVVGLVTLLAGYRLAWAQQIWRRREAVPRWFRSLSALPRFFFMVLPIAVGVLATLWAFLFMVPPFLSGLIILALTFLIPVSLAVVVAEGRGYQRTFCLGALFPACVHMLAIGVAAGTVVMQISHGPMIEDIGDSIVIVATGFVWLFILMIGLAAVGVRVLLERLQPPRRRWRE